MTASEPSHADWFLTQQIRQGNEKGWEQIVDRFQGRLYAYARMQVRDQQDAEDLVQEAFLSFLKSLDRYELRSSLESFLFSILRRRIVDHYRRMGRDASITYCSIQSTNEQEGRGDQWDVTDDSELTASQIAEKQEQRTIQSMHLWTALQSTVEALQSDEKFRDIQIFEMIFYAQLRNKDISARMDVDEKQVALIKHRFLKSLSSKIADNGGSPLEPDDGVLARLWEENRPSCPKRSTLGKYLLGMLSPEWTRYIEFHVHELGCKACLANLQDLQAETSSQPTRTLRDRISQSSIGFFRK